MLPSEQIYTIVFCYCRCWVSISNILHVWDFCSIFETKSIEKTWRNKSLREDFKNKMRWKLWKKGNEIRVYPLSGQVASQFLDLPRHCPLSSETLACLIQFSYSMKEMFYKKSSCSNRFWLKNPQNFIFRSLLYFWNLH